MTAPVLGVIPARLGSTRIPRKVLHPIAGRPLLEWVWRRVVETGVFGEVVVATDSGEVASVAEGFGARVELTSPEHPSGTDRVAEVCARREYDGFEVVVNVQGDEPFIGAAQLEPAVSLVRDGGWEIGTVAVAIAGEEEWRNSAVVKVVRAEDGRALLFSRAPIPFPREESFEAASSGSGLFLRHVGVYAYSREALARWVALPETALERVERLEQLRPLAAGVAIGVAVVEPSQPGVDTPEDLARAEAHLLSELHPAVR